MGPEEGSCPEVLERRCERPCTPRRSTSALEHVTLPALLKETEVSAA